MTEPYQFLSAKSVFVCCCFTLNGGGGECAQYSDVWLVQKCFSAIEGKSQVAKGGGRHCEPLLPLECFVLTNLS